MNCSPCSASKGNGKVRASCTKARPHTLRLYSSDPLCDVAGPRSITLQGCLHNTQTRTGAKLATAVDPRLHVHN